MSTSRGTSPWTPEAPRRATARPNGGIAIRGLEFMGSLPGLLLSFRRHNIYGGFAYLAPPRSVLGVDVRPHGMAPGNPRNPTEGSAAVKWRNCD